MIRSLWRAFGILALAAPVLADVDDSVYETKGAVASEKERRRLATEFAREHAEELQREATAAEAAAREAAEARAREAARPYPERLTMRHCTHCHPATNFVTRRHTRLGWEAVVMRMVYLNDAPIAPADQRVIAAYLSEAHGAGPLEALLELGIPALLAIAAPPTLVDAFRRRRGSRHGTC